MLRTPERQDQNKDDSGEFHFTNKETAPGSNMGSEKHDSDESSEENEEFIIYPSNKLASLTRRRNKILKYLKQQNPGNVEQTKKLFVHYREKIKEFSVVCIEQLNKSEVPTDVRLEFQSWYVNHLKVNEDFEMRTAKWLKDAEDNLNKLFLNPLASERHPVNEKEEAANQSTGSEQENFKLIDKKEKEANENPFFFKPWKVDDNNWMPLGSSNLKSTNFQNLNNDNIAELIMKQNETLARQNDITMLLAMNQTRALIPQAEPESFDGSDPMEYKSFILSFERTVLQRTNDNADRYYCLMKFTKGEANKIVKSCNYEDVEKAYYSARTLLDKHYGNEYVVANHYLEKLEKWKPIVNEDSKSLHEFSMFLSHCLTLMNSMSSLNQLNSLKEIRNIMQKLPYNLRRKFRDIAGTKMHNGEIILFKDLVQFVEKHSHLLQLPLFGDIRDDKNRKKNEQRVFHATTGGEEQNRPKYPCPCCKMSNHRLDDCIFFLKKSITEREDFIRNKKLCFGCLKSSNHSSRECKSRIKCKVCNRNHPTSLHKGNNYSDEKINFGHDHKSQQIETENQTLPKNDEKKCKDNVVSAHHIKSGDQRKKIKYPAVLVDIRFKGSNKILRTYMGLDPFCDGVFVDQNLATLAGVELHPTEVSLTTMYNKNSIVKYNRVESIDVISLDGKIKTVIENVYSKLEWPFEEKDSPHPSDIDGYPQLKDIPIHYENKYIGLLVGLNRPDIIKPTKIVHSSRRGPYATKHLYGWTINGPTFGGSSPRTTCFHVKLHEPNEVSLEKQFEATFAKDFDDVEETIEHSYEDKMWLQKVESSITKLPNNHIQMCLPFKNDNISMPNNFCQANFRLQQLKRKFEKNPDFYEEYKLFMKNMIDMNYVEKVPDDKLRRNDGRVWYLTHFAVTHKQKKKIRIVFDCSLKYHNICLNDYLLQGPDLINSLVGVLLRFRQEPVAFSADIRSMYYQVKVPDEDADFLRFLWFNDDNLKKNPMHYRLRVHVFGAKSSPSCANYALRFVANSAGDDVTDVVKRIILEDFYVDDLLSSHRDENDAIQLMKSVILLLEENGFDITSFMSNSRALLSELPNEKLTKEIKELDFSKEELPNEKTLGIIWKVQSDKFGFISNFQLRPCTKRGILSTLFAIYDPLFILSPAIVTGKRIFQECCALKIAWDDPLSSGLKDRWEKWTKEISFLNNYEFSRCYRSSNMINYKTLELHVFCDGSLIAHGAVAYFRFEDEEERIECSIVMASAKMTPLNRSALKTVPRIELNSAKIAVSLQQKITKEIKLKIDKVIYWSDSETTLNYIRSNTGRFHRFVANRVAFIRSVSEPDQWRYVPSEKNPADLLSRGAKNISEFLECSYWKTGPSFLSENKELWPRQNKQLVISEDDVELKKSVEVYVVRDSQPNALSLLMESTSNWTKLLYRVATLLCFKYYLKNKTIYLLNAEELKKAELEIWRIQQQSDLKDLYSILKHRKPKVKHKFHKLTPFIDNNDIIRVGGRLKNASISDVLNHPIILPKNDIVKIYCREIHRQIGHLGRESLIAELRTRYYIIGCTSLAKKISNQCIVCRRIQARVSEQIMAPLPPDRLTPDLPVFSSTGVDYFGPILVSRGRGRSKEKRYGVLFTCLASRAMHIEIAHSLDSDSFVDALRRFISRRGQIKILRSDNGTNFISGNKELKSGIDEWNNHQIDEWCKARYINWIFNPPSAPHMGGIWEREIRSIKKTFAAITSETQNKVLLTDEKLLTFICEVENILNNRPLTAVSNDCNDLDALTPNHLLRAYADKSFPPGIFCEKDIYSRRRWRQVQHLVEMFWHRWRREYIPLLISRQKWTKVHRSLKVDDLVLVTDQLLPRSLWCTGRVVDIKKDKDQNVRSATVKVARCKSGNNLHIGNSTLERPISKLILLKTIEEL